MAADTVENFKSLYRDATILTPDALAAVYSNEVVFVDPLHRMEGLDELGQYVDRMYKNVISCGFVYLDEIVVENRASIKWDMKLRHKRLAGGREIVVRGATLVQFDDRIWLHEDYFDVGALLYENVPVLGQCVRFLKNRLGK
ncbi:hypothetical protein AB833_28625 [Chromatiales bacterium (ex Bugula neritina AB1)]|nr:hypothetical protein AB833_28625 [Chromatiales bacterium (ex Bugula neritina AB1)]